MKRRHFIKATGMAAAGVDNSSAACLSAVLFTLLHTQDGGLSPFQGLIFLLGLYLAVLYEVTGDARVTMVVHAAHNTANICGCSNDSHGNA